MTYNKKIKRKFIFILFAIYFSCILAISTVPHLAEQDFRGKLSDGIYESHLTFPEDGVYGHYKSVVLFDKNSTGTIDLEYTFESNTLFIERAENIQELIIDCRLMYENKCQEVFEKDTKNLDADYYKTYFKETNNGLFTVIVNTATPMEKLQFLDTPMPKSVLVNNKEWWKTETNYYTVNGNDVTITHIPKGTTTVKIYFQDLQGKRPVAAFTASKYIALQAEEITFDASESYDEDGEILHYIWDFGDNSQGSGKIITHAFSELGNYTVTLTVRDNDYLEDVTRRTIFIVSSTEDSDRDGVPNVLDPHPNNKIDTDDDGLSDDFEEIISNTAKTSKDTDDDGFDDKNEWDSGTDPNDPLSHPPVEEQEKQTEFPVIWLIVGIIIIIIVLAIVAIIVKSQKIGEKQEKKKPKKAAVKRKRK